MHEEIKIQADLQQIYSHHVETVLVHALNKFQVKSAT